MPPTPPPRDQRRRLARRRRLENPPGLRRRRATRPTASRPISTSLPLPTASARRPRPRSSSCRTTGAASIGAADDGQSARDDRAHRQSRRVEHAELSGRALFRFIQRSTCRRQHHQRDALPALFLSERRSGPRHPRSDRPRHFRERRGRPRRDRPLLDPVSLARRQRAGGRRGQGLRPRQHFDRRRVARLRLDELLWKQRARDDRLL